MGYFNHQYRAYKMKYAIRSFLILVAITSSSFVLAAGHMSEDQQGVWKTVTDSWADETAENGKWPSEYVHEDAHSWGATWPAPRDSDSIASWSRFNDESGGTAKYELFPMTVTVAGDTAVVYYGVVSVRTNYEDKRERSSEGLIETLVRTDAGWKFIGLTSFEMGSD